MKSSLESDNNTNKHGDGSNHIFPHNQEYSQFLEATFDYSTSKIKAETISKYEYLLNSKNIEEYDQKFIDNLNDFYNNKQKLNFKFSKRLLNGFSLATIVSGIAISFTVFALLSASVTLSPIALVVATVTGMVFIGGLLAIGASIFSIYTSIREQQYQEHKENTMKKCMELVQTKERDFLMNDLDKSSIIEQLSQDRLKHLNKLAISIMNDPHESVNNKKIATENQKIIFSHLYQNEANGIDITEQLFLYSSGGGGHIQAKDAMISQAKIYSAAKANKLPNDYKPLQIDLMLDFLGRAGNSAVDRWNNAQKSGNVSQQQLLVKLQPISNMAFGPFVYNSLRDLLIKHPEVKEIVNTQAMCTKNICQAVLYINEMYNRNIKISLVMTDLPTKDAIHFWNGLKNLTMKERSVLELQTIAPQIAKNADDYMMKEYNKFFDTNCGPGLKWSITEPPVRSEFKNGNHRSRETINKEKQLSFKWNFNDEKLALDNEYITIDEASKAAIFTIDPRDTVISIMLGSQGGKAILDYTEIVIDQFQPKNDGSKTVFLVYCGAAESKSSALFNEMVTLINKQRSSGKIPKNLIIAPLGKQGAKEISEGLARADHAIMRTGGLASFEAIVISEENPTCKFLLHSESKSNSENDLLSSIPVWERGNAEFLISKLKATVVNPQIFKEYYIKFQEDSKNTERSTPSAGT